MKRFVEVYWTPAFCDDNYNVDEGLQLLCKEPYPLVNLLYDVRPEDLYLKCPSVIDRTKNYFVIQSPYDLDITIENEKVSTNKFNQKFFDNYIIVRDIKPQINYALLTLPPRYLFYTKESVVLEATDIPMFFSNASKNTKLISGEYDIGKWVRPVDWTVGINNTNTIKTKQNDPLFAIKLRTLNNLPIKFIRVDLDKKLMSKMYGCVNAKNYMSNQSLHKMYETAKNYLSTLTNGR